MRGGCKEGVQDSRDLRKSGLPHGSRCPGAELASNNVHDEEPVRVAWSFMGNYRWGYKKHNIAILPTSFPIPITLLTTDRGSPSGAVDCRVHGALHEQVRQLVLGHIPLRSYPQDRYPNMFQHSHV